MAVLAVLLAACPVIGCKVSVAPLDLNAFLDVPTDLAVDSGVDGITSDLPSSDVPGLDVPAFDVPAVDVPTVDLPSDDVNPADLLPIDVHPADLLQTDVVLPKPCGSQLNPNCTPAACDDGDPATVNDACVLDPLGLPQCQCQGGPDRCGTGLNPQCVPRQCDMGAAGFGLCQRSALTEECACVKVDVCSVVKPATTCLPLQCWLTRGTIGLCQSGLEPACGCKVTKTPCGSTDNPQCWSNVCIVGGAQGRCRPEGLTCVCVDPSADSCSDSMNPKCQPDSCSLLGGRGQCMLGPLGLCGCGPLAGG